MFLRKKTQPEGETAAVNKPEDIKPGETKSGEVQTTVAPKPQPVPASLDSLKELLEKNLKWSQIIYEQNRRIHGKLVWSAVANWLRVFIILIPLVLALIYLPPIIGNIWSQYEDLLGSGTGKKMDQTSLNNVFKMFNVNPAKQEQIKELLK
jgi:hypothetical protein